MKPRSRLNKRSGKLMLWTIMASIALSTSGCARLEVAAGNLAGKAVSRKIAEVAPPPKAQVVVVRGGNFCSVTKALGWPVRPLAEEAPALQGLSRQTLSPIIAQLQYGKEHCGWKP